jgi:hypothetical protein
MNGNAVLLGYLAQHIANILRMLVFIMYDGIHITIIDLASIHYLFAGHRNKDA